MFSELILTNILKKKKELYFFYNVTNKYQYFNEIVGIILNTSKIEILHWNKYSFIWMIDDWIFNGTAAQSLHRPLRKEGNVI